MENKILQFKCSDIPYPHWHDLYAPCDFVNFMHDHGGKYHEYMARDCGYLLPVRTLILLAESALTFLREAKSVFTSIATEAVRKILWLAWEAQINGYKYMFFEFDGVRY